MELDFYCLGAVFGCGVMLGVGLILALSKGWQLTFAGFVIAPIFAGVMALHAKLVVRCDHVRRGILAVLTFFISCIVLASAKVHVTLLVFLYLFDALH